MLLNKFKTKKVETVLTVGECLKRKREELNISLKDISEKLKIKIGYLENLEMDDYENLPPDVYVRGFVKSYAQFVGLNPEKMVNIYNREKKIENKIKKKSKKEEVYANKFTTQNFAIITPKIVTALLSLLVLFIVGYYLWHQISSFNSTPYLFVSNPYEDQTTNNPNITVEGETEKETTVRINEQDVFVDPDGYFKEEITLQPGKNVFIIEAINKFGKTAKETRNIICEKEPEPIQTEIKNEEENEDAGEVDLEEETEYDIEIIGP